MQMERIARAVLSLAGESDPGLPSPARMSELGHEALELLGGLEPGGNLGMTRLRTRWKLLLRRAIQMAVCAYRRLCRPQTLQAPVLPESQGLPGLPDSLDAFSSVWLAETIAAEHQGGGSLLVLGTEPLLAIALARITGENVFLLPWEPIAIPEARFEDVQGSLHVLDERSPSDPLPALLKGRFSSVFLRPPRSGLGAQRSVLAALAALDPHQDRRLYWTGHPARHLDYFGFHSMLAKSGLFMERLTQDAVACPVEADFAQQLLEDLLDTQQDGPLLDPEVLEGLLAAGIEVEHLHVFRPRPEIRLIGDLLSLAPLSPEQIPVLDGWLTPEFAQQVGFDEDRPRPSPEGLSPELWYPDNEWWLASTHAGEPVGFVNLVLSEFWTSNKLPWDLGFPEPSLRGKGFLNDMVRLGYYRIFEQLGAELLWSHVRMSNLPVRYGARSNFFSPVRTFEEPSGETLERIEIDAAEYRSRRQNGDILVPRPQLKK